MTNYNIIDGNEEDQATKEELSGFIGKGWITTLGDKKIDFISKNFADTIQNDNLPDGNFWETWSLNTVYQIPEENHQQVNVFANSWWVETDKMCQINSLCYKNPDGSYDFEIVAEYWPQRVFYFGVIISLVALLSSIFYLTFKRISGIVRARL